MRWPSFGQTHLFSAATTAQKEASSGDAPEDCALASVVRVDYIDTESCSKSWEKRNPKISPRRVWGRMRWSTLLSMKAFGASSEPFASRKALQIDEWL